jgi:hypothetical protein
MRFRIAEALLFSFIILMVGCVQTPWLPKSYVKMQSVKKVLFRHIAQLAQKDNFLGPSMTNAHISTVVDSVMNQMNQHNGQAIIVAHDGLSNIKFTCILDGNENIISLTTQRYSNDLGGLFKKCNIDQELWANIIDKFNSGGGEIPVGPQVYITLSYDFEKNVFLIKREHNAGHSRLVYRPTH